MTMKIKPMNGWVLVREEAVARKHGEIILPEAQTGLEKVSASTGRVVTMPNECWPKSVKAQRPVKPLFSEGDRVVYQDHLKTVNPVGEGLFLIHFEDLFAVVDDSVSVNPLGLSVCGQET